MSCTLSVPNELQDHIIDFVAPDVSSLRSCALVCRTWHPRSTTHLFSTMSVRTPGAFRALSMLVERRCVWLSHTRYLRLTMAGSCSITDIENLLRCMPQLVELTLGSCRWEPSLDASNIPSPAVLHGLRTLRIDSASGETLRAMTVLLGAQLPALDALDISGISAEDFPDAGAVLSRVGASLRTLRIGIVGYTEGERDAALQTHLSLSHLPQLQTLCITDLIFHPGKLSTTSYAWVPLVLRQCTARTLVFELDFPPVSGMGVIMPRVSARVSERLLDWLPWARCARWIPQETEVLLEIWPKQVVKAELVLNAVRRRLPLSTKIRHVQ